VLSDVASLGTWLISSGGFSLASIIARRLDRRFHASMLNRFLILLATVLMISAATVSSRAADAGADEKELAEYKLTMPVLKKTVAALRFAIEEAKKDPKYQPLLKLEKELETIEAQIEQLQSKNEPTEAEQARLEKLNERADQLRTEKEKLEEKLEGENPVGANQSLSDMEQTIRKFAPLARGLEHESLSPREYSKFFLVMAQAGLVHGLSQGKVDYAKLPPGVNPDNVRFFAEHKAEIDAMQQELEALGKGDRK
jgi:chromosome segregation ATPase